MVIFEPTILCIDQPMRAWFGFFSKVCTEERWKTRIQLDTASSARGGEALANRSVFQTPLIPSKIEVLVDVYDIKQSLQFQEKTLMSSLHFSKIEIANNFQEIIWYHNYRKWENLTPIFKWFFFELTILCTGKPMRAWFGFQQGMHWGVVKNKDTAWYCY